MKKKQAKIIVISSLKKMQWINIEDVQYLECAGDYTDIFLISETDVISVCRCLKDCCKHLDRNIIFHVSAHYAINVFHIKSYIKKNREVKFSDSRSITIPADRVADFYSFLEAQFIVL